MVHGLYNVILIAVSTPEYVSMFAAFVCFIVRRLKTVRDYQYITLENKQECDLTQDYTQKPKYVNFPLKIMLKNNFRDYNTYHIANIN